MVFRTNLSFNKKYHLGGNEPNSDDYVEYKHGSCRPKWCRVFGSIFACAGLLFCYLMTVGQLSCHKSDNVCLIQERHMWEKEFTTKEKIPLSTIRFAEVVSERHCGKDGCSTSYTVKLSVKNGERYGYKKPFHSSSGDRSSWEERAQKINNFLNYDIKEVVITESLWWFLFPLVFVLVGLFFIWIPKHMKKQAEKEKNPTPIIER